MSRVNVVLPDDLLEQIDAVAKEEGVNRSRFLRNAVLVYFEQKELERKKAQRRQDIQRAMSIQDQLRRESHPWDAISELRHQRERDQ